MNNDNNKEFADREQLYGPLYKFSDHKRGECITYRAYDGSTRSGEILWVQEPGTSPRGYQLRAQYVVNPDIATGMPDFVPLGDVLSKLEEVQRG